MRGGLADAILLLYPRRVRKDHGPEIIAVIDDLIAHDRRSRTGLFVRLAVDGLVQRIASAATVRTIVAVLATTGFGGLAVSDFAAASAYQDVTRTGTPSRRHPTHQTPPPQLRWHRTSRGSVRREPGAAPVARPVHRFRLPRPGSRCC